MNGKVKFIGEGKAFDVALDTGIFPAEYNKYITLPLYKCKELIDRSYFIPDDKTQELLNNYGDYSNSKNIDGLWSGERCFIIGSGSSLKGFNFSILDDELTIAINYSFIHYNKAKACLFIDRVFWDNNEDVIKQLNSYSGLIFSAHSNGYHLHNKKENVFPFYSSPRQAQKSFNEGLYNGRLSGVSAISLALILGCSKIYLLGFDLDSTAEEKYFYNHTGNKSKIEHLYSETRCKEMTEMFQRFTERDKIINCNLDSKIRCFDFVPIEDVLKKRRKIKAK